MKTFHGNSLLAFGLVAMVAAAATSCSDESKSAPDAPPHPRHLLLITVDTLRADRLHCYGGRDDVSPAIDRLAGEGTMFAQCHAPMGMTLACLTTLMTSKYPDETGVTNNMLQLDPGELTLAERLTAAGFRSRGFVTNGVLGEKKSGIDQGFDADYESNDNEAYIATQVREILAADFGKDATKREFLWVHFMNPHQPYDPPKRYLDEYLQRFDPGYEGSIDANPKTIDDIFVWKKPLAPRDLEHILAIWDCQVRFIDDLVGSILETLARNGLDRDTLVVLTADHGEELYDHNCYFYHANSIYHSVTHVPLIMRQPGVIAAGSKVDDLVELVDVMPTILGRLGIEIAHDENAGTIPRGMNLEPVLFRSGNSATSARLERSPFAFAQLESQIYAIRNKNWLYVDNPNNYMPFSVPKQGTYPIPLRALYDRTSDPREQTNVVGEREDVAKNMAVQLERWKKGLTKGTKIERNMSKEDVEELERLGYVGGK